MVRTDFFVYSSLQILFMHICRNSAGSLRARKTLTPPGVAMSSTTNTSFGVGHSGSEGGTGVLGGASTGMGVADGGKTVEPVVMVSSMIGWRSFRD